MLMVANVASPYAIILDGDHPQLKVPNPSRPVTPRRGPTAVPNRGPASADGHERAPMLLSRTLMNVAPPALSARLASVHHQDVE